MQADSTEVTEPSPGNSDARPLPRSLQLQIAVSLLTKRQPALSRGNVIVLPFHKILKRHAQANEIDAMEFVRANTTIPVPKILNFYNRQPNGSADIVMTQLPGIELEYALSSMTSAQVESVAHQLAGYIAQLRQLSRQPATTDGSTPDSTRLIGGVSGGPGLDFRLGSHPWGPFHTTAEFHTYLRFGEPLEYWTHEQAVMDVHGRPEGRYKVLFAHADLAPRNIMVDPKKGKITGIIDWEFGGWYPEYWEYIKMFYCGVRPYQERWFAAIAREPGIEKYELERKAEEAIWIRAGPFGYE
ncbi:kinase-like domain-containing protein [Achaetomium macrosporum]|uniref:Kinase-like domain-containing protein n=1 Tax=Achaetomium macrosporum TaxID=79813 RepID=A0AAN7H4M9_9PEZI|nr:kinase-like domain-containing protein [Achaetomium macrosporum]